ncbi:MAG: hypothetical protein Q4F13_03100 [Pseudomonadota bacterium]|nr:hypothetical protein [Pseudomonadota bacterium]
MPGKRPLWERLPARPEANKPAASRQALRIDDLKRKPPFPISEKGGRELLPFSAGD